MKLSLQETKKRLNKIYDQIPEMDCNGCGGCCGPIKWFASEDFVIKDYMKQNNIEYIKWGIRDFIKNNFKCPYLTKDKKCKIYPVRPIICRLQGHTEKLPCINKLPFDVSKYKANNLMMAVVDLDIELIGNEKMKQEVEQWKAEKR
jgi:Fe-S-cluster containining protein